MHSLPRFIGLALLASVHLITIPPALTQSLGPVPLTAPSLTSDGSPTAAMSFPNGSSLAVRSKSGRFPLVAANAGQSLNIQLQFAPNAVDNGLIVQSLDGGVIPDAQGNSATAADGTASIQFQTGSRPGLYRVLLNQGGSISILQFWVADPQQPNSGPPALQPQ